MKAMSTLELRRCVKDSVDRLSGPKLRAADTLLRQLEEEDAATTELLRIPGFLKSFQQGLRDVDQGRVTPAGKLRRKR
jgi:hypothetical protein